MKTMRNWMNATLIVATLPLAAQQHEHAAVMTAAPKARYIENKGQWPQAVKYHTNFGALAVWAENDRITFSRLSDADVLRVHDLHHEGRLETSAHTVHGHAWRMVLDGAATTSFAYAEERGSTRYNYFLGNDRTKWASNVHAYGRVLLADAWPGVTMHLHQGEGSFKYDVVLAPNADPRNVRFRYEGLDGLSLDDQGRLHLRTSVGEAIEQTPVAWYADGAREAIECRFTLKGDRVGFAFTANVDRSRPIVIDPTLIASTLSGTGDIGTTQNYGHTATYDGEGNIYTGAICFGQGYPTQTGSFDLTWAGGTDIAVSKLTADGTDLLASTYLGGGGGDYPHSLVVTPTGQLCVYGSTNATDYPTSTTAFDATQNGSADIVVTKLTPNMDALVGSTYVGTSADDGRNGVTFNYGDSYRGEIICDGFGNIYIASCSEGAGFPTSTGAWQGTFGGAQDGVLFRLNTDLSAMDWATYVGTTGGEMCFGVKLDGSGGVYACGATDNASFPTTSGAYQTASGGGHDGFVIHLTNDGSTLAHSTYFGYGSADDAFFIQLDNDNHVYIYGQTDGGIPIAPTGTYGETGGAAFVAEFQEDLSATVFTTTLVAASGGFGGITPVAFLVDNCRHIYISGYGVSSGLVTTPGALYVSGGFYLACYDQHMTGTTPLYATYYEGAGHVDGGTSRFDKNGIVYQAVCTSGGFPTTPGAWSNTQPGGWDVGVFKIDFEQSGVNANIAASALAGCAPDTVDFTAWGEYVTLEWDFGDGSPTSTDTMPSHVYTTPGTYIVTLIAYDPASCNLSDTATITVQVSSSTSPLPSFTTQVIGDCDDYTVQFTNTTPGADNTYTWDMGDGTTYATVNVTHVFPGPGTYDVTLTVVDNLCGATGSATQPVTIGATTPIEALFTALQTDFCNGLTVTTTNQSTGPTGLTYTWDMGDGTTLSGTDVSYTYNDPGSYIISLEAYDPACDQSDDFQLEVLVEASPLVEEGIVVPNIFSPNNDGENELFFEIPNAKNYVDMKVYNRWGQLIYETPGNYQPWDGRLQSNKKPAPDGVYFYLLDYKVPCLGTEITGREEGYVHIVR